MKLFIDFYRIVLMVIIIANISACTKEKKDNSENVKRIPVENIAGDWVLHHYFYIKDWYYMPPARQTSGTTYPDSSERYKFLTIDSDSILLSNHLNKFLKIPAQVLKTTLSGNTFIPSERDYYEFSGKVDYDTLRLTLNERHEFFKWDGTSGYYTTMYRFQYKMVYYLKK